MLKTKVQYYLDTKTRALRLMFREANKAVSEGSLIVSQEWWDSEGTLIRIVTTP